MLKTAGFSPMVVKTKTIEPPTLRSCLQLRQRRQEAPAIRVLTRVVVREPFRRQIAEEVSF